MYRLFVWLADLNKAEISTRYNSSIRIFKSSTAIFLKIASKIEGNETYQKNSSFLLLLFKPVAVNY